MEREKFAAFVEFVTGAFMQVAVEMTGVDFTRAAESRDLGGDTIAVIIGLAGAGRGNKGRIMLAADMNLAMVLANKINGEDCADTLEFYLCLSEFANIFCGSAVSKLNNAYRGSELRLTPPAVFGGAEMEIVTPEIHSEAVYCASAHGPVLLNIGFEGVR